MRPVVVDASSAISEIEMWHSGNLAVAFCHTRGGRMYGKKLVPDCQNATFHTKNVDGKQD